MHPKRPKECRGHNQDRKVTAVIPVAHFSLRRRLATVASSWSACLSLSARPHVYFCCPWADQASNLGCTYTSARRADKSNKERRPSILSWICGNCRKRREALPWAWQLQRIPGGFWGYWWMKRPSEWQAAPFRSNPKDSGSGVCASSRCLLDDKRGERLDDSSVWNGRVSIASQLGKRGFT